MDNILVIIPARGGSKGLPGKNIKKLNGKPLIHYSIEVARSIFKDEQICVSTDREEIKEISEQTGLKIPFIRPDYLASDTAGTREVLLHALEYYQNLGKKIDTLVLLQPTSPLRNKKHILEALSLYNSSLDMVVSVKETVSNPYYVLFEENSNGFLEKSKKGNFTRRQDCPKVWEFNGSIYIINSEKLKEMQMAKFEKVIPFEMTSYFSQDIDTINDFEYIEYLIKKKSSL
jgi:CMP-N,N'-diacetyllegionaminic acid synthase